MWQIIIFVVMFVPVMELLGLAVLWNNPAMWHL